MAESSSAAPPREVYARPCNRFVADFVGFENIVPGRVTERSGGLAGVTPDGGGPVIWAASPLPSGVPVSLAFRSSHLRIGGAAPGAAVPGPAAWGAGVSGAGAPGVAGSGVAGSGVAGLGVAGSGVAAEPAASEPAGGAAVAAGAAVPGAAAPNTFTCLVTESVYLGSRTNLTLDAGGLTLSGYVDDADLVRLGGAVPSPGDKTTFTLPPAHVVALSGT